MSLDNKGSLTFYKDAAHVSVPQSPLSPEADAIMNHFPCSLIAAVLPDEKEHSAGHLAMLADLACASGDRQLAESLIERLYAHYDRQHSLVTAFATPACPPRR